MRLFWRSGQQRAVLDGQAKLIRQGEKPAEFYQLANDLAETKDLSREKPADAKRLAETLEAWNKELVPPAFLGLGSRKAAKPGNKNAPRPAAPAR